MVSDCVHGRVLEAVVRTIAAEACELPHQGLAPSAPVLAHLGAQEERVLELLLDGPASRSRLGQVLHLPAAELDRVRSVLKGIGRVTITRTATSGRPVEIWGLAS